MTAQHGAWAFDYRTATPEEILARARRMVGMTLGVLSAGVPTPVVSSARTRGDVGAIVEAWFGIPPNARQEADFPGAGIELKTVPLSGSGNSQTVKERTVLTMVDYERLPEETWQTAAVRHKLDRILLVYVGWAPETDIATFPVVLAELWRPDERQLAFMELDWLDVRQKVLRGEAHLISEGDGLILGAATKAADGTKFRRQPFSDIPAKPRAWSLKQSFTRSLYLEIRTRLELETLMDTLAVRRAEAFEEAITRQYRPYVGRTVGEVARALGVQPGGKHYAASVVRRALGQRRPDTGVREFRELGIELKMVRADASGMPYEAMSFPAFRYRELAAEAWEESDLLTRLNRLLVVPLQGPRGMAASDACVLREPFFWSPTSGQLAAIRVEWETVRDLVIAGRADRLPTASQTRYVHVRPKARDSRDTDDAPGVGPVVRKCFWLNRSFVRELLREHA